MSSDDVDLLVDAARAGGGWAFGRLWEEMSPAVAGYLRGRGIRDTDDVASEVFLAAFMGIGKFTGDGRAFRSWLFAIAHHKSVDVLRRRPSREVPTADVVDDRRTSPSAEDSALAVFDRAGIARLLGTLTPEQRNVVLLRVIGELSLAETAAAIGKPLGAVKQLQHRALARLRKEISGQPISPDALHTIAWMR